MPFQSGARLGPYEIVSPLGAGGMGEVYRARDTRLDRDVALKILPDVFMGDADRLARFEREAKTLASLNHPNIAPVYGLEESGGVRALVMELVEGDDLSVLIARGPIPLADALSIARQIADALEAAHEQGIVHRDLKPANIKVRPDGTVKVLDFGLAKAMDPAGGGSGADATNSPTITARATALGMIIGTAAYMAPEQARGRAVDRRADIWAFGVVLYEMLSGKRAFDGDDISVTLASVLKEDVRWDALPADLPVAMRRLLRRSLEKDPKRRLSSIGDARLELEEAASAGTLLEAERARAAAGGRGRHRVAWTAAAIMMLLWLGTLGWAWIRRAPPVPLRPMAFPLSTGAVRLRQNLSPQVSPDGTMVAFVAPQAAASAVSAVWIRDMDDLEPRRIAGTEGASANDVFWKPDSRSIGFVAAGNLKRVVVAGGAVDTICPVSYFGGATWTPETPETPEEPDGNIIFSTGAGGRAGLFRVNAKGGKPVEVARPDASRGELAIMQPWALPGGRRVLYIVWGSGGQRTAYASSLDGTAPVRLLAGTSKAMYAEPGFLLFTRERVLYAQRFDATTLHVSGEPARVADEVLPANARSAAFSASQNGVLVYHAGVASSRDPAELVWLDRHGAQVGTAGGAGSYRQIRLSPDGERVAVEDFGENLLVSRLSVLGLATGVASTLTNDTLESRTDPVWSPDSAAVAFEVVREGGRQFFQQRVGEGGATVAFESPEPLKWLDDWSADGKWLLFHLPTPSKLYAVPPTRGGKPMLLLDTPETVDGAHFSPRTNWIAYMITEAGTPQVWVAKFPEFTHRQRVSIGGGGQALWHSEGRGLCYLTPDGVLMEVSVTLPAGDGSLGLSTPTPLFQSPIETPRLNIDQYAIKKDGQRFLFIKPRVDQGQAQPLTVKINWTAGLK